MRFASMIFSAVILRAVAKMPNGRRAKIVRRSCCICSGERPWLKYTTEGYPWLKAYCCKETNNSVRWTVRGRSTDPPGETCQFIGTLQAPLRLTAQNALH